MGEVVQLVSRATTAAEKNLAAFVSLARDELTAFSEDGAWDGLTWRDNRWNRKVSVVFCKYRPHPAVVVVVEVVIHRHPGAGVPDRVLHPVLVAGDRRVAVG